MNKDININFMSQKFDIYYKAAKENEGAGKFTLAKRNYLLCAELLMEMAKVSSKELAKAKMERAKRLIDKADSLGKDVPKKTPANNNSSSEKDDEEGKTFKSAEIPNIHFSDIAGLEDVKESITIRMIYPLKHPEIYSAYKKQTGGGVLLYGPPGTGKTMIAKAIACEVGATFYAIKGSDIVSKWVGESEKNINSLFETARKDKLAIIFIDEIDNLLGKRGVDSHNDKRVNEFLQQLDGFGGKAPNLLFLGATNRPWDIDSAAMRSGRFSEKIYVPLPDEKARKFLFEKNLKDVPLDEDVNINQLVELTNRMSGADISEICDGAKIEPLKNTILNHEKNGSSDVQPLNMGDFLKAINRIKVSVTDEELQKYKDFDNSNGL